MKNIIPNENCLTEVQLLRYLHDECTPVEEKAIDRHLTHCPMCSDALEGAMLLNKGRLERSLAHLNTKITTEYADKTPIVVTDKPVMTVVKSPKKRGWLWAAAGVAAVATAGVLVLTKPIDTQPIEPTVATTDSASNVSPSMASVDTNTQNAVNQTDALKKQRKTNTGEIITQTTSGDIAANSPTTIDNNAVSETAKPADAIAHAAQTETTKTTRTAKNNNDDTEGEVATQNAKSELKMQDVAVSEPLKKAKETRQVQIKQAPNNVNGGAAQASAPSAAKAKASVEEEGVANFQQGMVYYKRGAYKDAINELNRVLALQNKGDVYENALWYLADAYIQIGNKAEGKVLLKRIVSENGKFAQRAAVLLK